MRGSIDRRLETSFLHQVETDGTQREQAVGGEKTLANGSERFGGLTYPALRDDRP